MTNSNLLPFSFPAVGRKAVTAAFDGGRLTSDGGVMLLSMAERRLGIAQRLAHWFPDRRDPLRITHTLADMVRARILAIACGYEDADDLDALRVDPAFKLACGRLPDTGADLLFAADAVAAGERAFAEGRDPADMGARRSMDGLLRSGARLRHSRYRRHLRCRARASAALALQRPLRRALLSADPCL